MSTIAPFNPKTVYPKPRGENVLSKFYDMENNCIVRVSLDPIGAEQTNYDKCTDATESFRKVGVNPQGSILIMEWGNGRLDVICTNPADETEVTDYLTSNPNKPRYLFETYQRDENGWYASFAKPNLEKAPATEQTTEAAVA